MGHSSRSSSTSQSYSDEDGGIDEEQLTLLKNSIENKDAINTVDTFCLATLPFMPDNTAKLPIYYGIKYGCMFLYHANENDFQTAITKLGISIASNELHRAGSEIVTDKVSGEVFNYAESHNCNVNKSTERFVEKSLNTVISSIISEGSNSL